MNISKHIIQDLLPLYAANECSEDTRALVDAYLAEHPSEAEVLRRAMGGSLATTPPSPSHLSELNSLNRSRRRLQLQSLVMGLAILFTLAPFAFFHTDGETTWLFMKSPISAGVYLVCGVFCWLAYVVMRQKSPLR
ncbi:MAG: hypothetical protein ACK553_15275 [Planctomycetota bacterium]|jgi:ferric-dicitrate binding protein FerR (iron transport regulator)